VNKRLRKSSYQAPPVSFSLYATGCYERTASSESFDVVTHPFLGIACQRVAEAVANRDCEGL